MKNTLLISALLGLLIAIPCSASLYGYYQEKGITLPSVSDRVSAATECGISGYSGTYEQNIIFESCLRNSEYKDELFGSATSTIVTPTVSLKGNNIWTGNNTSTGYSAFTGNTSLATTTINGTLTANYFNRSGNFYALEPITNNNAIMLAVSTSSNITQTSATAIKSVYGISWWGQSFSLIKQKTEDILYLKDISFKIQKLGTGGGTLGFRLYSTASTSTMSNPSLIYSTTIDTSSISSAVWVTTTINISTQTTTWFYILTADAGSAGVNEWQPLESGASDTYTGGRMATSTNVGSTFGYYAAEDFAFNITYDINRNTSSYPAVFNLSSSDYDRNRFIGFSNNSVSAGEILTASMDGMINSFSDLKKGNNYCSAGSGYISICSSSGNATSTLGKALSSSTLFIKQ